MKKTKSILIVGGSGFVGVHLAKELRKNYKVFATYNNRQITMPEVSYLPMSISDRELLKRVLCAAQPEAVIYLIGNNDVDWCEKNPRDAETLHGTGSTLVASLAELIKPRFIYVSFCHVFDGRKGNYNETDIAFPHSMIGRTKLAGENFLKGKSMNYVVVRSSPVFGLSIPKNPSFIDKLRIKLEHGERVDLPTNELHSFAPVQGLVDIICRLVESGIKNTVFHYGGLTKINYYDFGVEFSKRFGYNSSLLSPIEPPNLEKLKEQAIGDYSLNCSKAVKLLKIKPLLLKDGLDLIQEGLVI